MIKDISFGRNGTMNVLVPGGLSNTGIRDFCIDVDKQYPGCIIISNIEDGEYLYMYRRNDNFRGARLLTYQNPQSTIEAITQCILEDTTDIYNYLVSKGLVLKELQELTTPGWWRQINETLNRGANTITVLHSSFRFKENTLEVKEDECLKI